MRPAARTLALAAFAGLALAACGGEEKAPEPPPEKPAQLRALDATKQLGEDAKERSAEGDAAIEDAGGK